MTQLTIFSNDNPNTPLIDTTNPSDIEQHLAQVGVTFRQWPTFDITLSDQLTAEERQHEIMNFYQQPIAELKTREGYQTVDVISLSADNPQKEALRQKFLNEHTHSEDEVRFFVEGKGLFSIHLEGKVFSLLCEKGDLINVPANTPHWFDMGSEPNFTCIRLFNNPEGWVAQYTKADIADRFPRLSA